MPLFIQKNPNPQTLIAKTYANLCPSGYEPSTEENVKIWVSTQLAAGWTPAPVVQSSEDFMRQLVITCENYSQNRLDALAKSWGYDDIVSLVSYKGDLNPRFNAEGTAGFNARSAEWTAADNFRTKVENGLVEPTLENYITALPVLPDKPIV